ncbi:beta strand repeat-containing protein, partial [Fusobacterium necrophorum]
TEPTEPQVIVNQPGTISSLGEITVTTISPVTVNVTTPNTPSVPTINAPTVTPPSTPAGFEPRLITPPGAPEVTAPVITEPAELSYSGTGANPEYAKYSYWNLSSNGANDGNISQTSVKSGEVLKKYKKIQTIGTYNAEVDSEISLKNYVKGDGVLGTGTNSNVTEGGEAPINATNLNDSLQFFMTLLNSPYSYFGEDSRIAVLSPNDSGNHKGTVINLETEGIPGKTFQELENDGKIDNTVLANLNDYTNITGLTNSVNGQLYHVNKGIVEIGGKGARYIHTTYNGGGNRVNVVENRGKIISMNYKDTGYETTDNIVYFHSPDSSASGAQHIYVNHSSGKIDMYGEKSVLTLYTASTNQLNQGDVSFINDGDVNLYGRSSTAIAINEDAKGLLTTNSSFIVRKAINLYGDNSVGLYVLNSGTGVNNNKNQVKFTIGKGNLENLLKYQTQNSLVDNTKILTANGNKDGGDPTFTEGVVGIFQGNGASKTLGLKISQLDLEKYSKKSIAVYVKNGTLNAESSVVENNININGGEDNVGLYAAGGDINFKGNLTIGGSKLVKDNTEAPYADDVAGKGNNEGKGNIGIYAAAGKTVHYKDGTFKTYNDYAVKNSTTNPGKIEAVTQSGVGVTRDGIGVYSEGIVKLEGTTDIKLKAGNTGENTGIFAKGAGAKVTLKIGEDSNNKLYSQIEIDGKKTDGTVTNKGIGLFSQNGGEINADGTVVGKGLKITVKNGASTMVATGVNSKVNAKFSTVNYDGNGYAVYTKDGGKIDISNGEIILHGSSTAMEIDKSLGTNPVTFTNGKITVMSNDVIVYNLLNLNTALNISNFENAINGQVGTGIKVVAGEAQYNKWKLAAVDGGIINIDTAISKTDATGTNGDYFFKKFLGQRLKINVNENVAANLTTAQADADYNGQVVGIEANSSTKANSNSDTQVSVATGKKIEAARTDGTDKGATGVFINYGQVDNKGTISVEKDTTENENAVGVYAVNGSQVSNSGTIEAGGNQSVGILGMAYRTDSTNNPVQNEFGGKSGEGLISITNDTGSKIAMSGEKAIGIYAQNNNAGKDKTHHSVKNAGEITVEKKNAIGIYGDKVTIENTNSGQINIGENAVGIYAKDSAIVGNDLGEIHFKGDNGVGLYVTGDSTLVDKSLQVTNTGNKTGNVAILFDQSNPVTTGTEVVGTADNIISYYTKSSDLTVTTAIKTNKSSVGIAGVEEKKLAFTGTSLKVGESSTGVLGKKNEITLENSATIELIGNNAVGIYSDSDGVAKDLKVNGKLKFASNVKNAVGVYALNGTDVKLDSSTSVDFTTAKNNIGFYIAGSSFSGNPNTTTLNYNHEDENIYIYAQGSKASNNVVKGSTVSLLNKLTLTPADTSSTKKAIGIYLDTAVKGSTTEFEDNTLSLTESNAKIEVSKKSIGVYAKNASTDKFNILSKPKITAIGKGTVGVYTDGNLKLSSVGGTITAKDSAVGVYGNSGKIEIDAEQNIVLENKGTGFYLTNGTKLEGSSLNLKNNTAGTAAAGVYYTKGNATSEVEHKTELHVKDGNNLLALYADGGIKLKNSAKINVSKGTSNVGAFVTGSSELNNNANITLSGNGFKQGLGIYVANGKATNSTDKTIKVEDKEQNSLSVAMAADKIATGTSAIIVNAGNIEAIGDAIGMSVAEGAEGINAG